MANNNEQNEMESLRRRYRIGSGFETMIRVYERASPEERNRLNKKLDRIRYAMVGYGIGFFTGVGLTIASTLYGILPKENPSSELGVYALLSLTTYLGYKVGNCVGYQRERMKRGSER